MAEEIRAPIFIIGCPRSGTTVFYEKFAQHPDLAYVTRATRKAPASLLLARLWMVFRRDRRPREARVVWDRFTRGDGDALGREDATPEVRSYLEKVIRMHLALFRRPRFLNKCPGNAVRVEWLDALFPDAIFVHMIRDGRAVVASLLQRRLKVGGDYWGVRPPGWREFLALPPLDACALQWKVVTEHALSATEKLPRERCIEVRYEDFTERPAEVLSTVAQKCGLAWDPAQLAGIVGDVESRNYKWRQTLRPDEVARLNELLGDLLARLGYEL